MAAAATGKEDLLEEGAMEGEGLAAQKVAV